MLVVAICAMCGSLACAQESYVDISIDGELACRINQNFNRLETTKYLPDNVFLTEEQSEAIGRAILKAAQSSAWCATPALRTVRLSILPKSFVAYRLI